MHQVNERMLSNSEERSIPKELRIGDYSCQLSICAQNFIQIITNLVDYNLQIDKKICRTTKTFSFKFDSCNVLAITCFQISSGKLHSSSVHKFSSCFIHAPVWILSYHNALRGCLLCLCENASPETIYGFQFSHHFNSFLCLLASFLSSSLPLPFFLLVLSLSLSFSPLFLSLF